MNKKCPACQEDLFEDDCLETLNGKDYHVDCYWDVIDDFESELGLEEEMSESPGYFFTEDGSHLM